jgi:hypothetical protein
MSLLDRWRKQTAPDEWIESFCDLVKEWKPVGWAEEKGQISAGIGPALDRRCRERQAYNYREQFPTRGDKAVRAQSIRGRMAGGDFRFIVKESADGEPWIAAEPAGELLATHPGQLGFTS